jgi:DNA-binding CsgD family transcriptional regulator
MWVSVTWREVDMVSPAADEIREGGSSPLTAFIFYCPQTGVVKEQWAYNAEAWRVLCGSHPSIDPDALCARWKAVLDERLVVKPTGPGDQSEAETGFIDLYESGRRKYGVRGVILWEHSLNAPTQGNHYLFLFERIVPESVNLRPIARAWGLCPREEEIVRLLISDRTNKEIAHHLNLSLNTVKGYLKLLMRKLGVGSRTGVLARLLTGKSPPSHRLLSLLPAGAHGLPTSSHHHAFVALALLIFSLLVIDFVLFSETDWFS